MNVKTQAQQDCSGRLLTSMHLYKFFSLVLFLIVAPIALANVDTLEGTAGGMKYRVVITKPIVFEHEGANCSADSSIRFESYSFYFRDENPKPTPDSGVFSIVIEYRPDSADAVVQWDRIGLPLDSDKSINGRPIEFGNVFPVKTEWNERRYFHMVATDPGRYRWAWQVHGAKCTARFVLTFAVDEV